MSVESILTILSALSTTVGAVRGSVGVYQWLSGYLRKWSRETKTSEVQQTLRQLGLLTEADIRNLVENWDPEQPIDAAVREELINLFTNLARGARFHTTHGTPLSTYLRCGPLIEQLLSNLQPKRRAGQAVSPGRLEWKLEKFLGMGSFGEVWVGKNPHFPQRRAFKFFTTEMGKEWLKREATALSRIKATLGDHPNIVEYLDIALDATPFPLLVLEYVEGGSLEDWILTPAEERSSIEVSELVTGIARGLAAAHRHGISHRDLKPANVLLTAGPDPDPKIADFGLGRVEPDPAERSSVAQSQAVVVGTPMYLPPEAADPYEPRTDAQDDVFAFGVVWYQVLTGKLERPPYDFAERLHQQRIDSRTARLLSRCLAYPDRRFQDAQELLAAMEVDEVPSKWNVPEGCFDVGPLAREYLESLSR